MSPLCHQVQDFLHCAGYNSLKVSEWGATNLMTLRRQARSPRRRGTGLAKVCGFELKDGDSTVTVRFSGRKEDESSFLTSYARVLLNCGFEVETDEDPERDGWQSLTVSRAS